LQPVREAIRVHGGRLLRVAIDRRPQPRLEALTRFARDRSVPTVVRLPAGDLDALAGAALHQGAVAWAPPLTLSDPNAVLARPDLIAVALDQIQDPQNFGAAVRSAVAIAGA